MREGGSAENPPGPRQFSDPPHDLFTRGLLQRSIFRRSGDRFAV